MANRAPPKKFPMQDPKIISVFEILAAYETDCVFNHVYHSAKTRATGDVSLTDEYVRCIQGYTIGVKTDEQCYSEVVRGLWKFFTSTTRFTTLSFAEFVDRVVGLCVPEDYFRQFSASDKDEILSSVLCDLVSNLGGVVTHPDMLRRIIDEHDRSPDVTVRMLQDACVNILITKRGALHNKFLKKIGQARELVSIDVFDDMKSALRRLVKEKADAQVAARRLEEQLQESKVREAKLRKLVELLRSGRDDGEASAGAGLRVPRRCHRAEPDPLDPVVGVPRRSRLAQRRGESPPSESEESEEGEGDTSESDAPPARRPAPTARPAARPAAPAAKAPAAKAPAAKAPAAKAPAKPHVPAGFFKTSAPPAVAKPVPAVVAPPQPTPPPAGERPAMLSGLLDNVVDMDDELAEYLD